MGRVAAAIGLLNKETFPSNSAAVLALEGWTASAKARGRGLRSLFALVDQRDPDAVIVTLATRMHWEGVIEKTLSRDEEPGPQMRKALQDTQRQRATVYVFVTDGEFHFTRDAEGLAAGIRGLLAKGN